MSKKRRTKVPDFSSARTKPGQPTAAPIQGVKQPATPVQRAKPQVTSAKSGQRGQ